jgi:2-amino-4-hydroxy-6-hydroxymethyldihydropteridine diphosphokinase
MAAKKVYAGLGSNLGNREELLLAALRLLEEGGKARVLRMSRIMESAPLAQMEQPDYLNAAAELQTNVSPVELVREFMRIEDHLGRVRSQKWGARPIDIDLLLYGDEVLRHPEAMVPHPQMHLRSFVMMPLCELAPDAVHPVLGQTMTTLAARLGGRDFVLDSSRPQLVGIAGVVGVGKTTLAEGLSRELGCDLVREAYDSNPFLERVCAGEKGLALDCQIYFLTSRAEQLAIGKLAAGKVAVSDYVFDQEKVFAGRWLDQMQLDLYMKANSSMAEKVWEPVVTIFLYDTMERCLERIRQRGRSYEQKMSAEFLKAFEADYETMFAGWNKSPVLRVDAGKVDCKDQTAARRLAQEIRAYITVE